MGADKRRRWYRMTREEAIKLLCVEKSVIIEVDGNKGAEKILQAYDMAIEALSAERTGEWIPVTERLPSKEEMKEWIDNNLDGIGYLYPCLVTRYSSINPDRTKYNPYVAKHYFDGEDFVDNGEEACSEYIIAWMPLPEPYKGGDTE